MVSSIIRTLSKMAKLKPEQMLVRSWASNTCTELGETCCCTRAARAERPQSNKWAVRRFLASNAMPCQLRQVRLTLEAHSLWVSYKNGILWVLKTFIIVDGLWLPRQQGPQAVRFSERNRCRSVLLGSYNTCNIELTWSLPGPKLAQLTHS
jgi:hypothetical protein